MKGMLLFAHGARDPEWGIPFQRLQHILARQLPDTSVLLCFLELMSPSLPEAVAQMAAQGISHISIVPLFLGPGSHLRKDFPVLLEGLIKDYPDIALKVLPALGESEAMLQAIADWIMLDERSAG